MAGGPTRKDTFKVDVSIQDINGSANLGVWDKKTGGNVDSEEYKFSPGAMGDPVSLGGRKVIDNVVVSRLYRLERDHVDLSKRLINGVGKAKITVSQQPLDINGNAYGRPMVWTGTLKRFSPPEVDSESSDAALAEIEITVEGQPTV